MSGEQSGESGVSRRSLLRGIGVGGLGLPLLAACAGSGDPSANQGSGGGPASQGGQADKQGSGGSALTTTSAVPVGGGEILARAQVVVTQPSKGDFKAFSAICTHAGCLVGQVSGGVITCPCHLSQFSVKDGSVVSGPAPAPLPAVRIAVRGNKITRA